MRSVMMLVNEFPPQAVGGAERQAERLAGYLAGRGCAVKVITRSVAGQPAKETRQGFQIDRIPAWGMGKLKTVTFLASTIRELFYQRDQYDLLHAHLAFGPALAGALVGRMLKKPVLIKFGNSGPYGDVQQSIRKWRGRLRLAILRKWVDTVIVLDPQMKTEVLNAGFSARQVRQMPNGIHAAAFEPCSDKSASKAALGLAGKQVLIYTGRFSAQKSIETLLQALKLCLRSSKNLHLLMVGDGEDRGALEELAQHEGIKHHVTFTGPQPDVRPYLDAADIFVLPSLSEGISNSLLEAMSAGMACIATTVGGTPDVLEQGACGILVEPARPDQLADAIQALVDDPARCWELGQRARQRILRDFDFDVIGQRYIDLYEELVRQRRSA